MEKTKVLIADDHNLVRRLLADMLASQEGIEVVGLAASGLEAVNKARELHPDLVLMDLKMPGTNGVEATRIIHREMPSTGVLVLTMSDEDEDLLAAMKAGAKGYLLKSVEPSDLIRSIHLITGGHAVIHPLMTPKLVAELGAAGEEEARPRPAGDCSLTERETQLLGLLAQGRTNKEIANNLRITETTVKSHVHSILNKLRLTNRVQATKWALENDLVREEH
ncbi:MAG: response regulator transcription factor [Chloroflexi bacterium]|nr:response regulator transcription factor [Chloroflexota bacterium]